MIDVYERQKLITKLQRVVAGRLGYSLTPDFVRDLLTMRLKDGDCLTEQEAHRRVTLANENAKAAKTHQHNPLRFACFNALLKYFKTLDRDARKEQIEQLGDEVESTLAEDLRDESMK